MATGSINAQLALIAAGTINIRGLISAAMEAAAKIGMSRAVVAVFDVASVKAVTNNATVAIAMSVGTKARLARSSHT